MIGSSSSPSHALQIEDSFTLSAIGFGGTFLKFGDYTGIGFSRIWGDGTNMAYSNNNGYHKWMNQATELMRLTSGGNLLIGGTSDDGYKLNVNGIIRTTSSFVGENVIIDGVLTPGSILFEEYKDSIRKLMNLHRGKKTHKKDKNMIGVLDDEIKKERTNLLKIIKPRFKKVFGKYFSSLKDDDILRMGMYLSTFLKGLKQDYPQYKINMVKYC